MRKILLLSLIGLVSSFAMLFCAINAFPEDEEALGQQAERKGQLKEAITHYTNALRSVPEGSPDDERVRKKIIEMPLKFKKPLPIPDEVLVYEGRAEQAVKSAQSENDFLDAAQEYKKALSLAPWASANYYNLGAVYEKAGRFDEAARNYRYYLLAAPQAGDAVEVKKKIAGLEYEMERQVKRSIQEKSQYARWDFLLGSWNFMLYGGPPGTNVNIKNWGTVTMARKDNIIEGYELRTATQFFNNPVEYPPNPKPELILRGTLPSSDSGDIKWEVYRFVAVGLSGQTQRKFETIYLSISPDKKKISFKYPAIQYDLQGRASDYFLDYVLTR